MPLQNRVDPFGRIVATTARGMFTGNRGVIHDPETRTLLSRRWTTRAWIICECAFGDRRREVMGRNAPSGRAGWTELFFLDEVTALAAGHRPCFYCRRERAIEYVACLGRMDGATLKAPQIDERLHRERMASGGEARTLAPGTAGALPDGAMVAERDAAFAILGGRALRWSFGGYGEARDLNELNHGSTVLLTPATTILALHGGYAPVWHGSAGRG